MSRYRELNENLKSLINGIPHKIANLANAVALLFEHLENISWAGFYFLEGEKLVLGPFQGKVACIEIAIGKGVCGSCVARRESVVVPDVHKFPGHIACDSGSNSEIVIPIYQGKDIIGVLDIDSYEYNRFNEEDRIGLEEFCCILSNEIFGSKEQ